MILSGNSILISGMSCCLSSHCSDNHTSTLMMSVFSNTMILSSLLLYLMLLEAGILLELCFAQLGLSLTKAVIRDATFLSNFKLNLTLRSTRSVLFQVAIFEFIFFPKPLKV